MSEFKFGDDIVEPSVQNSRKKRGFDFKIIIVIVVSLVVGISVFALSNSLFGKKTKTVEQPVQEESLKVDSKEVKQLYGMVTYGMNGTRAMKYLKEKSVKLENFTNYEKFYYALSFAEKENFSKTDQLDPTTQLPIYALSNSMMKKYMKLYFGDQVKYSTDSSISYSFSFDMDQYNSGTLAYDVDRDGYVIVFHEKVASSTDQGVIQPYYTKLEEAVRNSDGEIILKEKVIYVTSTQNSDGTYSCKIYRDYNKTMLIEEKTGITEAMLAENPIDVSQYKDNANTITYTFKENYNGDYYFYSSFISN